MYVLAILYFSRETAGGDLEPTCDDRVAGYDLISSPRGQIAALAVCKADEAGVRPSLVLKIIRRESKYDPEVCNKTFGCGSGQGLMQIIPHTERSCERALGRDLDVFSAWDNLDCGMWLIQTRGIQPWEAYSGPY